MCTAQHTDGKLGSLLPLQLLVEGPCEAGSQPSSPCPFHHRFLQLQQTQDGHSNVILTAQDGSSTYWACTTSCCPSPLHTCTSEHTTTPIPPPHTHLTKVTWSMNFCAVAKAKCPGSGTAKPAAHYTTCSQQLHLSPPLPLPLPLPPHISPSAMVDCTATQTGRFAFRDSVKQGHASDSAPCTQQETWHATTQLGYPQ